ncbi:MAG: FAA hydrolase family protein [Geminicoccaceae bacterium]|nr:MAG: FAA hydrolase family protein [Geminicoccaceae bacterium]
MRLVTVDHEGQVLGAVEVRAGVVPLNRLVAGVEQVLDVIRGGEAALDRLRSAMAGPAGAAEALPWSAVRLLAPLPRPPRNLFCVGKNYVDHAAEFQNSGFDATGGVAVPELPIIFTKATTAVSAPEAPIPTALDPTGSVDYEGELAVVIGRGGRAIPADRAFDHVFGYTIVNDVTARKVQHRHKQWFLGKSPDGFGPMGPAIVTADAIPHVGQLRVQTRVNGELRQDAPVSDLIFDIPTLIATISASITLEPGDVIATGTPAGVGIGFDPPRFLEPGDRVEVTVAPIGTLANPVT